VLVAALISRLAASADADPPRSEVASAVPAPTQQRASEASVDALLFDVERIVEAEEGSGWLVDERSFDDIFIDVMASTCSATAAVRRTALDRLAGRAATLGDPRRLFEHSGGQLTPEVETALTATRRARALERAVRAAPAQCPFWVRADAEFRGLQSTRDRFVLSFDTGGLAQLRSTAGQWALGAGGSGRLLVGYGFTRMTLLGGIEIGGGALLEPDSDPTRFLINYLPALPLVLRLHQDSWHYDLEVTPVALFQAADTRLSYGARGAFTLGVSALRVRGVLPWVGIGVAVEHYLGNAARPRATYFRSGLRVGGVWGP
jgi:hypothetical protein